MDTKRRVALVAVMLGAFLSLGVPSVSLAEQPNRPNPADSPDGWPESDTEFSAELTAGTVARYRVLYTASQTSHFVHSAVTVISLTNNGTATCETSVDWRYGSGGLACTTNLTLGPGQTKEHCTRGFVYVSCNAICIPALDLYEGNAVVGIASVCQRVAAYPRVYYMNPNDVGVAGVADVKMTRINSPNAGD